MQAPPPLLAAIQPSSCGAARVPQPSPAVRLEVAWAASEQDVREAQRLRYRVFAGEMLARLSPPPGTQPGLDADGFDPYCDHLLVRAVQPGDAPGQAEVVGTYRVLPPARARAAGGFYTDTEFDLAPLSALRPRALELGRSCVHPHWRLGGVVLGMWSALAAYMLEQDLDTMIGCASMSVADGGAAARTLWRHLRRSHLADPPWRVRPHTPLPIPAEGPATADDAPLQAPPLIKGYLRCGARLLGPPAFDPAFNTADLPMMLRLQDMAPRYRRHLLAAR
jgi:putative hemolysin